jgi:thioredoxin 1
MNPWIFILLLTAAGAVLGGLISLAKLGKPVPNILLGAGIGAVVAVVLSGGGNAGAVAPESFHEVTSPEEFDERVLEAERPVLVDFYSDHCIYCKQLTPTLETLTDQYAGEVTFVKVNVAAVPELARRYQLQGTPTVLIFLDGKAAFARAGNHPIETYRAAIEHLTEEHVHEDDDA